MNKTHLFFLAALLITSCAPTQFYNATPPLASIDIVDANGLSQTISTKDRLYQYEEVDFLDSQPYQKVMRVYEKDHNGEARGIITSYHSNGNVKQLLEVVNGRARGIYREWFSNGQLHLEAQVVGGTADLNPQAESSWLFSGTSLAWNEEGCLIACLEYESGVLHGPSIYYHNNGQVWKEQQYDKGVLHGKSWGYTSLGEKLYCQTWKRGLLHGPSIRWWPEKKHPLASKEFFQEGLLINGEYWDLEGGDLQGVKKGHGVRIVFGKQGIAQKLSVCKGRLEGLVESFSPQGFLVHSYYSKDELKSGTERYYYTPSGQTKLEVCWYNGSIQGTTKTWYENGVLESQREMSESKKNGLTTIWYKDGSIMALEEYKDDQLIKGEYHRPKEHAAVSRVRNGNGTCTLFDGDGNFLRRISYENGDPV